MLELLAYGDPPRLKVHLIPGQAQAFPLPETGEQAQRIGSLKGVSLDGFQEQRDFRIRQGRYFLVHGLWKLRRVAGIGLHKTLLHSHGKRLVENCCHVLHSLCGQAVGGHTII